jgi:hypothetical protein
MASSVSSTTMSSVPRPPPCPLSGALVAVKGATLDDDEVGGGGVVLDDEDVLVDVAAGGGVSVGVGVGGGVGGRVRGRGVSTGGGVVVSDVVVDFLSAVVAGVDGDVAATDAVVAT